MQASGQNRFDSSLYEGAMLGFIVGDAYGVFYEFEDAADIETSMEMRGYGTFNQPPGAWSDDSSLMLIAAEDYLAHGEFSIERLMDGFVRYLDEGYMTPYGVCFDIGSTTYLALERWKSLRQIAERGTGPASNGGLMRILPAALACCARIESLDIVETLSECTHNNPVSSVCAVWYSLLLESILNRNHVSDSHLIDRMQERLQSAGKIPMCEKLRMDHLLYSISSRDWNFDISSDGNVADTLYVAVRSFQESDSFSGCIQSAVQSGGDTDTNAALVGGLAGAYYGRDGIPLEWQNKIARKAFVDHIVSGFIKRLMTGVVMEEIPG